MNPWRLLSGRIVYDNPWISVREDQVIRPDGKPGIYGVVSFKNLALSIVPVTAEEDTFLIGQYRYPLDVYSWETPQGGGQITLPPRESAARELKEEAGLIAQSWTQLGLVHTSNCVTSEVGMVFLAQNLTEVTPEPDGDEILQIKRLPLKTAVRMALDGDITDAMSVVALLRAWYHLHPVG